MSLSLRGTSRRGRRGLSTFSTLDFARSFRDITFTLPACRADSKFDIVTHGLHGPMGPARVSSRIGITFRKFRSRHQINIEIRSTFAVRNDWRIPRFVSTSRKKKHQKLELALRPRNCVGHRRTSGRFCRRRYYDELFTSEAQKVMRNLSFNNGSWGIPCPVNPRTSDAPKSCSRTTQGQGRRDVNLSRSAAVYARWRGILSSEGEIANMNE